MIPKLYIARTADGNDFPLPTYTSEFHVGLNLMAAIGAPIKVNPNERIQVPVGFAIGIPQGFCGQIVSPPVLSSEHGIVVSGAPFILNPADRDPLFVLIQNISSNPYVLHRGDQIAQLLIMPVVQGYWQEITTDIKDEVTDENTMIVDEGIQTEAKKKGDPFASFRRHKASIRNRYKNPDEDEN